ncbi:MAG: NifU family protein [Bdellovibrionota bacterium]
MSNSPQYNAIKNFIEEKIAPGIMAHGGEVSIVSLNDGILTLLLSGSCGSCSVQAYTSESISNFLLEEFPDLEDVIVTE